MATHFGTLRVVTGARYGLRDWLVQRVSAVVMALFTLALLLQLVLISGPITYEAWAGIFAPMWMKLITYATVIAFTWHVFVGMRDLWMDYVKPVGVRLALHVFTIAWLVACAAWAFQVLWRI